MGGENKKALNYYLQAYGHKRDDAAVEHYPVLKLSEENAEELAKSIYRMEGAARAAKLSIFGHVNMGDGHELIKKALLNGYTDDKFLAELINENIPQNIYLTNDPDKFAKMYGWSVYEGSDAYDLFQNISQKHKANGRRVPVYQMYESVIPRENLTKVITINTTSDQDDFINLSYPVQMRDPASHYETIYMDKDGNFYAEGRDFNDYGNGGTPFQYITGKVSNRQNSNRQNSDVKETAWNFARGIAANWLDGRGEPMIIKTGIQPLNWDAFRHRLRFDSDFLQQLDNADMPQKIKDEIKTYKKSLENLKPLQKSITETPNVDINKFMKVSSITNIPEENVNVPMKKFGGKLRYGWGGFEEHFNTGVDVVGSGSHRIVVHRSNQDYPSEMVPARNQSIFGAMMDKKDDDISRIRAMYSNDLARKFYNNTYTPTMSQQNTQPMRYGGIRKFNTGGQITIDNPSGYSGYLGWGTQITPDSIPYKDYSADNEDIVGKNITQYATSGLGIGASIGGVIGSVVPGLGNILGAIIGGVVGAGAGAGYGAYEGGVEKTNVETTRKQQLAYAREKHRQNVIDNMNSRYEYDIAKLRTTNKPTNFNSFYNKYGGLIPMKKYNYGGIIPTKGGVMIPTSDDTMLAKGATHEQGGILLDPQAEVENNEVIRATPTGDQIFSDSLYVPGTRVTYAKYANKLSRQKGKIEDDIKSIKSTLTKALDEYPKLKQTHAQDGTSRRNMEKLAAKLNIKTGQLAQLEQELSNTFMDQEEQAYALGLRDTEPVMAKYGGNIKKHKFGVADMNLIMNGIGFIGNMIGNELTYKSNKAQLDFMKGLKVPKQARLETQYHKIDTTPYEQARRKMAAETRRFNKWIENEVSNPQVLRNQKRKALIGYYEGLGDIAAQESAYRTSIYDKNYNARVNTDNMNRQIAYQDALAEYNRDMDYYNALLGLGNQAQSGRMAAINQLMQATSGYLNQRMYLASLAPGVQKEFYWGKKNG